SDPRDITEYEELTEEEREALEQHVASCSDCRLELEEGKTLFRKIEKRVRVEPTEALLVHCRNRLMRRLREGYQPKWSLSGWQKLSPFSLVPQSPAWQWASAAALLVIGIVIGRFLFLAGHPIFFEKYFSTTKQAEESPAFPGAQIIKSRIANLESVEYDPGTQEIQVRFNTLNQMVVQGKIQDKSVRQILAYALINEEHPGIRLKIIKALGMSPLVDEEMQQALIHVLEHDENPGLRLKVIKVLKDLPINDWLKYAFIRMLRWDSNPRIRMAAMEALSKAKGEDVTSIFLDAAREDENDYVRLQASRMLETRSKPIIN
ncbi:MAG: HEAT repeat domain-containing protein, partial [candidate division KSB1 bacterium]|nr:HEAT repeat domain-containing protein [candidate division KSB1 bacterium]